MEFSFTVCFSRTSRFLVFQLDVPSRTAFFVSYSATQDYLVPSKTLHLQLPFLRRQYECWVLSLTVTVKGQVSTFLSIFTADRDRERAVAVRNCFSSRSTIGCYHTHSQPQSTAIDSLQQQQQQQSVRHHSTESSQPSSTTTTPASTELISRSRK